MHGSYISRVARRRAKRWFIPRTLLVALAASLAQFYFPWWSILISAGLIGFLTAPVNHSPFWSGFLGLFLSWVLVAAWINIQNESLLSSRVVQLFPLANSVVLLILVTGILGGLLGGFASWTGDSFRRIWIREQ